MSVSSGCAGSPIGAASRPAPRRLATGSARSSPASPSTNMTKVLATNARRWSGGAGRDWRCCGPWGLRVSLDGYRPAGFDPENVQLEISPDAATRPRKCCRVRSSSIMIAMMSTSGLMVISNVGPSPRSTKSRRSWCSAWRRGRYHLRRRVGLHQNLHSDHISQDCK
jgi:hypothetical protein